MGKWRIKPYYQQVAEREARERQRVEFRRRQAFGLLLVAGAILVFWILRGHRDWFFTPGWWRL
jgi:hypothetical protein